MKKLVGLFASAVLLSSASMSANSFEFDDKKLYAGGGLGYNSLDSSGFDSAIGFQGFAGYHFDDDVKIADKVGLAAEIGYTSSGDFKFSDCSDNIFVSCSLLDSSANGLWANAVFDYDVNAQISALGRVGLDLGDDDGLMFGFGGAYKIDEKLSARVEYVIRQNYSSLQANVVYDF